MVKKAVAKVVKKVEKKPIIEKPIESDDDSSVDMSEEEMKKMLGEDDNSDIDSDEFSEETEVVSKEAKANKKRKLESDDDDSEEVVIKKKKISSMEDDGEEDLGDESCDEEDEDEDDEDFDESFIDDDDIALDDDDEEDEESTEKVEAKPVKKVVEVKETKNKDKKLDKKKREQLQENSLAKEQLKKMYEDVPVVEGETLRKEIFDRLEKRKNTSIMLVGLPQKFNNSVAKELVPELVSVIIPFNMHRHQINGNAYIDLPNVQLRDKYVKKLNNFTLHNKTIKCFPITKCDEKIENYNCTRLAISNLSMKANLGSLKRVFIKAVNITIMPMKKLNKNATRIAFAEYSSVEDAIEEYDNMHGTMIEDTPVNVKFQSRSNTNIKKSISWDKTTIEIIGINKQIKMTDLKKLFPQAIQIYWKDGHSKAQIKYENEAESQVDMDNAMKNKPYTSMKIFFKCLTHKTQQKKVDNDKKEKSFNKKPFQKKDNQISEVKTEKKEKSFNKKPFEKKDNQTSENKSSNKKPFKKNNKFANKKPENGVKKTLPTKPNAKKFNKNAQKKFKMTMDVNQFKTNSIETKPSAQNTFQFLRDIKTSFNNHKVKAINSPVPKHEARSPNQLSRFEKRKMKKEKRLHAKQVNKKKQEQRSIKKEKYKKEMK